ncbi:MAG TPA: transcription elongation factor GreAB, partial [Opitutae bacterium]|nr:transcription elongation factor GreAB [Opitutae bacterium]
GRHLHEDVETLIPTSRSIVEETENLALLAEELPSAYHKRFLDLIARTYTNDWEEVVLDLLKNSSGKFVSESMSFLIDRDSEPRLKKTLEQWLDEQSLKGPVIHWILKNRNSKKFKGLVESLISPRLLSLALYAIDYEALHMVGSRRIPLADFLSDDAGLIAELLEGASNETARDLAQTLMLNQGFEELTKKSLMARFIKCFSNIQSLLESNTQQKEDEKLIVSKESLEYRKKEYEELINVKIPENKEAIAVAREHGDLKENSEYKMARQDQDMLLARKSQLEIELAKATVTDFKEATNDVISIGSVVEVIEDSSGELHRYAILGAWDSNPEKNILSYQTPLAQSLLGQKVDSTVMLDIDGTQESWTVKTITRWLDQ